jgi:hypothetical protein
LQAAVLARDSLAKTRTKATDLGPHEIRHLETLRARTGNKQKNILGTKFQKLERKIAGETKGFRKKDGCPVRLCA